MPRRPRPVGRILPKSRRINGGGKLSSKAQNARPAKIQTSLPESNEKHIPLTSKSPKKRTFVEAEGDQAADQGIFRAGDESELEGDGVFAFDQDESDESERPRAAQWMGEDEIAVEDDGLDDARLGKPSVADEKGGFRDDSRPIQSVLEIERSQVPFGVLLRAREGATNQSREKCPKSQGSSSGDSSQDSLSVNGSIDERGRKEEGPRLEYKLPQDRKIVAKRANKHAPAELTSKKPVTRRRTVVEVQKVELRDPRFSALSGEFSADAFASSYSFLPELQRSELGTLKESVKAARKVAEKAPTFLREQTRAEVGRLERTAKRLESAVERNNREARERAALANAKKIERAEQGRGKGAWHMGEAQKRQLLLKSKYDALAGSGGQTAVRKAIEKKHRKVAQKDKKSRPFFADSGSLRSGSRTGVLGERGGSRNDNRTLKRQRTD